MMRWTLSGFFCFICLCVLVATAQAAPVTQLSAVQAHEMLKEHPGLFLLDVRTPQEHAEVRLPGPT